MLISNEVAVEHKKEEEDGMPGKRDEPRKEPELPGLGIGRKNIPAERPHEAHKPSKLSSFGGIEEKKPETKSPSKSPSKKYGGDAYEVPEDFEPDSPEEKVAQK